MFIHNKAAAKREKLGQVISVCEDAIHISIHKSKLSKDR